MRMTVLGGCGAWPEAERACGGYLVEHEGFRLLIDPGYGVFARLIAVLPAEQVDAILISHGHPDHCADVNPLLRARALGDIRPPKLSLYALPGALDAVLALDNARMLADAYTLVEFSAGQRSEIGPFTVDTWLLPHFVPNAGMRITAAGRVLSYTGDTGPSPEIVTMASDADVLLAEATFAERILPPEDSPYLSTASQAGEHARQAEVGRLVLTHLWPGTGLDPARQAARRSYQGPLDIALPGLTVDLG